MRKRRKNKAGTKYYMIMSIICLCILFVGYSYVYKLSEARKTGQDVTTISFNYDREEASKKYSELCDKVISYFNILFEETFKETDDSSITIDNVNKNLVIEAYKDIENNEKLENNMDLQEDLDLNDSIDISKAVYDINSRKENFFKVIETDIPSRSSVPREMSIDTASINKNTNIILYHTHGTEAYASYKDSNYRTTDENYNVTGIGSIITTNMLSYGINVTHLKEYNDYPSYNSSYSNSNYAVKQKLSNTKKNIIIDLHRDGAEENSSYEEFLSKVSTIKIKEKTAATFSLIIGDKNGNLSELKKTAQILYNSANEMYPGICRDIVVRTGAYFNQYLSDNALLIEIGSTANNLEEVQYTADLLSEILCKTIAKINN